MLPCCIKGCSTPAMMLLGSVRDGENRIGALCPEHFVEAVGRLMERLGRKVGAQ